MKRTLRVALVSAAVAAVSFAAAAPADAAYAKFCDSGTGIEFGVSYYNWDVCL